MEPQKAPDSKNNLEKKKNNAGMITIPDLRYITEPQ